MTSIELINLTLNEIRRSAQVVADVKTEQEFILNSNPSMDSIIKEVMTKSVSSSNNALEYCRKALRDVLEHIAEYQNSQDILRGVDTELGKVAYDLIYERKTNEDYEHKT